MVENIFITKILNLFKNNEATHIINIKIKNYNHLSIVRKNIENEIFKFCYYDPNLNIVYFYINTNANDNIIKDSIRKILIKIKNEQVQDALFTFSIFKHQEEIII